MPDRKASAKAELCFLAYTLLGNDRTIARVVEACKIVGVQVSQSTLEKYSARYHWIERVAEVETQARTQTQRALVRTVAEMNEGQAVGGHAMQAWAMENAAALRKAGEALDAKDIVAVHREGREAERLALGEATGRTEHITITLNTIIQEIGTVFISTNDMALPADRARAYADGADAVLRRHWLELTEGEKA